MATDMIIANKSVRSFAIINWVSCLQYKQTTVNKIVTSNNNINTTTMLTE